MYTMTVAPGADVSGGFYSLKAAFAAMPEDPTVPVTIRVMPGIYHENYPSHARTSRSRAQEHPRPTP